MWHIFALLSLLTARSPNCHSHRHSHIQTSTVSFASSLELKKKDLNHPFIDILLFHLQSLDKEKQSSFHVFFKAFEIHKLNKLGRKKPLDPIRTYCTNVALMLRYDDYLRDCISIICLLDIDTKYHQSFKCLHCMNWNTTSFETIMNVPLLFILTKPNLHFLVLEILWKRTACPCHIVASVFRNSRNLDNRDYRTSLLWAIRSVEQPTTPPFHR